MENGPAIHWNGFVPLINNSTGHPLAIWEYYAHTGGRRKPRFTPDDQTGWKEPR
jgi:hypothetical protein